MTVYDFAAERDKRRPTLGDELAQVLDEGGDYYPVLAAIMAEMVSAVFDGERGALLLTTLSKSAQEDV